MPYYIKCRFTVIADAFVRYFCFGQGDFKGQKRLKETKGMTRTPRHCEEGYARRGNAAIKPRAESSSLELCQGGAGSTEGQSQSSLRGL